MNALDNYYNQKMNLKGGSMSEEQKEYGDMEKFKSRVGPAGVPAVKQVDPFLAMVELLSSKPDIDVEKIKQLKEMQESILDRNAKQAFNASMVRAQKNMPTVFKAKDNTQTHSKYAGYEDIVGMCQPVYTAEGFSVTYYQGHATEENPLKEGHNRIMADVMHEEGHTKTVFADIPVETTGPKGGVLMTKTHATGSAFSYGRSYLIRLIFNIPTGDDDNGNAAGRSEFITDEQRIELEKIIVDKGVDAEAFFKYMKVETTGEILSSEYGKAKNALKKAKGSK